MKKTIYFRVDADQGRNSGLGHIIRILQLYRFLKKKFLNKMNFIFLIKKNSFAFNFIRKNSSEKIIYFSKKNMENLRLYTDDIFIIDTLGIDKNLSDFLNKFNVKKRVSFDELNTKRLSSGIIINGIYFTKKKIKSSKKIKVFQGEKFIFLNNHFQKKKNLNYKKKLKRILVMSGGADFKNFLFRISDILKYNKNYHIRAVIGPGVKRSNKIFKLKDKNFKKIKSLNNLYHEIKSSDLCVCTGGTVMFEAIACGQKPLIFENYPHQKHAINFFKNKNAIIYGGKNHDINQKKINFLLNVYKTTNTRKVFSQNTKLIDGKGFDRIKKIIYNYIR